MIQGKRCKKRLEMLTLRCGVKKNCFHDGFLNYYCRSFLIGAWNIFVSGIYHENKEKNIPLDELIRQREESIKERISGTFSM